MTARILFAADQIQISDWRDELPAALNESHVSAVIDYDCGCPESYDYIVCSPRGGPSDFSPFTNLKAVLSIWAGVESLASNPRISCPICRMVDPGMIEGMTEWVTAQVLRHHLNFDRILAARPGEWLQDLGPPLAGSRTVAVLGLGQLGMVCAHALAGLNFRVIGWSRSPKTDRRIDCRSGEDGLAAAIGAADIVVLLLPHTPATENLCDSSFFANCKPGAVLINSGRGALIAEDDLIAALDSGRLSNATLDVFRKEPLPADHPFWTHPKVSVWPHIASETRSATASRVIAENVRRGEQGEPFLYMVDRDRGY